MKTIILEHMKTYPLMEISDVAKLIYQSEFGGGHMIANPQMSLQRIQEEYRSLEAEALHGPTVVEPIGNGLARIYLSCLEHGVSAEVLNEMFVHSANNKKGTVDGLKEKIALVIGMCETGELSFSVSKAASFFDAWEREGYPAMSHSSTYRENYHPAYRVVETNFVKLYETIQRINCEMSAVVDRPYVVAVDGMSGSGKSTFASLLQKVFPESNLFHMDDYFLRPSQRTVERLGEVGGNVDYERFSEEILACLEAKSGLSYRPYDCCSQMLREPVLVDWKPLVIIEGSYSHHPYFGDPYDCRVFLEVSPEEQRERILRRNGEFMLERFISEWIPKENAYFEKFEIKNAAAIK